MANSKDRWFIQGAFNAIEEKMHERLQLIGELVSSTARQNAPVLTGALRDSITFEVDDGENTVVIGTNKEYAAWIELGTRFIAPRFFLTQAYSENIPKIRAIFSKQIKGI